MTEYCPTFWLNGELTHQPMIAATNRGLLAGQGLFETLKVANGKPQFVHRHLERLMRSCHMLDWPRLDTAAIATGIRSLIQVNAATASEYRLRVTCTQEASSEITVLIGMSVLNPWPATTSCTLVPWVRNENSVLTGIKTTSYFENILAMNWAQDRGFSEGLFANSQGNLSEGATSNIFVVIGGEVVTPSLASGVLPGITRGVLLDHGLAHEKELELDVLKHCTEMFLTSSTRGVHPVERCGERLMAASWPLTKEISEEYAQIVAHDMN